MILHHSQSINKQALNACDLIRKNTKHYLLLYDASCFNKLSFKLKFPLSSLRSNFCSLLSILQLNHALLHISIFKHLTTIDTVHICKYLKIKISKYLYRSHFVTKTFFYLISGHMKRKVKYVLQVTNSLTISKGSLKEEQSMKTK